MTDIIIPTLGNRTRRAVVKRWLKSVGDTVRRDEPLAQLEFGDLTFGVIAPVDGYLAKQLVAEGEMIEVGERIAQIGSRAGSRVQEKSDGFFGLGEARSGWSLFGWGGRREREEAASTTAAETGEAARPEASEQSVFAPAPAPEAEPAPRPPVASAKPGRQIEPGFIPAPRTRAIDEFTARTTRRSAPPPLRAVEPVFLAPPAPRPLLAFKADWRREALAPPPALRLIAPDFAPAPSPAPWTEFPPQTSRARLAAAEPAAQPAAQHPSEPPAEPLSASGWGGWGAPAELKPVMPEPSADAAPFAAPAAPRQPRAPDPLAGREALLSPGPSALSYLERAAPAYAAAARLRPVAVAAPSPARQTWTSAPKTPMTDTKADTPAPGDPHSGAAPSETDDMIKDPALLAPLHAHDGDTELDQDPFAPGGAFGAAGLAATGALALSMASGGPGGGSTVTVEVPQMGESVTEGTVGEWRVKVGDTVRRDDPLAEIETDKVAVEIPSPADGVVAELLVAEGDTVTVGAAIARIRVGAAEAAPAPAPAAAPAPAPAPAPQPQGFSAAAATLSPAVERVVAERGLDPQSLAGTGPGGRVTKGDALGAPAPVAAPVAAPAPAPAAAPRELKANEERVRMTRLRQTIARRLKEAQNTAAILTTFNDVDMSEVMSLRKRYKDTFEQRHGIRLGFMSFFVKACVAALRDIPEVNAEIDGTDIIYKNHYDIAVAVGTEKGLVTPVVRNADQMTLAEVEKEIAELGRKAREGELSMDDLQGGTFTISNGGVYGSLMSTPIINPPQSAILGMHRIEERPVVVNGEIVIRPMMYLALSYDHRLIDGQQAVTFLVRVKENIEDPERLMLEL